MCQHQVHTCSATSVTEVMSNIILPLAQKLNLNRNEINGTVYTDLYGAIVLS